MDNIEVIEEAIKGLPTLDNVDKALNNLIDECPICGNKMPKEEAKKYRDSDHKQWHRRILMEAVVKAQAKLIADLDW